MNETESHLQKRAEPDRLVSGDSFFLSQVSIPPGVPWDAKTKNHNPDIDVGAYFADPSLGQGQTIYAIDDEINENDNVRTSFSFPLSTATAIVSSS